MTGPERETYIKAVFEEFDKVRGRTLHPRYGMLYSPAEFDQARKWAELGIPLATVLQAIRETGGKPRTLHACERAVQENNARRAQAVPERHPLLEPLSMSGWDPAAERARIMKRHGRGE